MSDESLTHNLPKVSFRTGKAPFSNGKATTPSVVFPLFFVGVWIGTAFPGSVFFLMNLARIALYDWIG